MAGGALLLRKRCEGALPLGIDFLSRGHGCAALLV